MTLRPTRVTPQVLEVQQLFVCKRIFEVCWKIRVETTGDRFWGSWYLKTSQKSGCAAIKFVNRNFVGFGPSLLHCWIVIIGNATFRLNNLLLRAFIFIVLPVIIARTSRAMIEGVFPQHSLINKSNKERSPSSQRTIRYGHRLPIYSGLIELFTIPIQTWECWTRHDRHREFSSPVLVFSWSE